jgi:hypothetical protein
MTNAHKHCPASATRRGYSRNILMCFIQVHPFNKPRYPTWQPQTGQRGFSAMAAAVSEGRRGVKILVVGSLGYTGVHPPQRCGIFGKFSLKRERIIQDNKMCPFGKRHRVNQESFGRDTERKTLCQVPECAGIDAKRQQELMTNGAGSVNSTCCLDGVRKRQSVSM